MKIFRDIAFSRTEPPKSFIWLGLDDNGDYFIRVWSNGWQDITSSAVFDVTLSPGDGIYISKSGSVYTIGVDQSVMEKINEVLEWADGVSIGTAADVDEICK